MVNGDALSTGQHEMFLKSERFVHVEAFRFQAKSTDGDRRLATAITFDPKPELAISTTTMHALLVLTLACVAQATLPNVGLSLPVTRCLKP